MSRAADYALEADREQNIEAQHRYDEEMEEYYWEELEREEESD